MRRHHFKLLSEPKVVQYLDLGRIVRESVPLSKMIEEFSVMPLDIVADGCCNAVACWFEVRGDLEVQYPSHALLRDRARCAALLSVSTVPGR